MRFTVDIPRNHPSFSTNFDDFVPIVSDAVGGIYAYVKPELKGEVLSALNRVDPSSNDEPIHWELWGTDENNERDFQKSISGNQLDVLRVNGENSGWLMRNNEASLRLLQVMNGLEVKPLPDDIKFRT